MGNPSGLNLTRKPSDGSPQSMGHPDGSPQFQHGETTLKGVWVYRVTLEYKKVVRRKICIKRTTYPPLKETLLFWRMDGSPLPFQTHITSAAKSVDRIDPSARCPTS